MNKKLTYTLKKEITKEYLKHRKRTIEKLVKKFKVSSVSIRKVIYEYEVRKILLRG